MMYHQQAPHHSLPLPPVLSWPMILLLLYSFSFFLLTGVPNYQQTDSFPPASLETRHSSFLQEKGKVQKSSKAQLIKSN